MFFVIATNEQVQAAVAFLGGLRSRSVARRSKLPKKATERSAPC